MYSLRLADVVMLQASVAFSHRIPIDFWEKTAVVVWPLCVLIKIRAAIQCGCCSTLLQTFSTNAIRFSDPCKFFGCELGAQVQFDLKNERYIVNGAHDAPKLQDLLFGFIKKFVLCQGCDNPETKLVRLYCCDCGICELFVLSKNNFTIFRWSKQRSRWFCSVVLRAVIRRTSTCATSLPRTFSRTRPPIPRLDWRSVYTSFFVFHVCVLRASRKHTFPLL